MNTDLPTTRSLPCRRLGAWVADAACADLDDEAAAVFTADAPDADALAEAEAVCWRCPVRRKCGEYASGGAAYGLWGADWYDGKAQRRRGGVTKAGGCAPSCQSEAPALAPLRTTVRR